MAIKGLILFGDSILAGTGASDRHLCCAKLIKSALTIPISLRARNWNTSEDGLRRLENDVIMQHEFSHVLILFGNNDCWFSPKGHPQITLEQMKKNLMEMGLRINDNNQTPIFCNLQPIDSVRLFKARPDLKQCQESGYPNSVLLQEQYNDEIENVATEMKFKWIDIRTDLEKKMDKVMAPDGLHPNNEGHRIIAHNILEFLKTLDLHLDFTEEYEKILTC